MKIILILLIVIVSACLILYLYCHFENAKFRITEYEIFSDKIDKEITMCVIADLHNYSYGQDNERLMLAIDLMKPDVVVSAGDMVEAGRFVNNTKQTICFLKALSEKYNFIYGIGNHEHSLFKADGCGKYARASKDFIDALKENELSVMRDEGADIADSNVRILSLDIDDKYYRKFKVNPINGDYIKEKLGKLDDSKLNILIGHDPYQLDGYAQYGADLVLSGHVHGGMICLPNGRGLISTLFTLFPKYYAGLYEKDNTLMIVSRGVGNHTVHVRINNRAELLKIKLKRA